MEKNDKISEMKRYTDDIDSLIKMIHDLYLHIQKSALKYRITKIGKKMKEYSDNLVILFFIFQTDHEEIEAL